MQNLCGFLKGKLDLSMVAKANSQVAENDLI
jgi:hypothetical protein